MTGPQLWHQILSEVFTFLTPNSLMSTGAKTGEGSDPRPECGDRVGPGGGRRCGVRRGRQGDVAALGKDGSASIRSRIRASTAGVRRSRGCGGRSPARAVDAQASRASAVKTPPNEIAGQKQFAMMNPTHTRVCSVDRLTNQPSAAATSPVAYCRCPRLPPSAADRPKSIE